MNDQEAQLIQKHAEMKKSIDKGVERAFPAFFFKAIGKGLQKLFRLEKLPDWRVSASVLFLLFIYLPGFLVAVLTGEILQWGMFHWYYFGLITFGYCSSLVCYINVTYNLLPGIGDDIVDSILTLEDLQKLENWLDDFWSIRKSSFFSLAIGLLTAAVFTLSLTIANTSFIGWGLTILTFLVATFYVGPLYAIFSTITLPTRLASFHLRLYESDPINSEVIQRLVNIMNIYLYWVAGYVAVGTALLSLNPVTSRISWLSIFIGWIPSIFQFLSIQYAVRKMVITAKWQNSNRLQAQIRELQSTNLAVISDAEIIRLNKLMDLHDRISARPNSILNWGTGLSFLNQLLLPLLGLFLGNLDKLIRLLTGTP